jgi:hypothetical protein
MQPALFWRTLLCLNGQRLRPAPCSDPAHFDIAAHNPIDASGPNVGAQNIDDISTPDLGRLKRILSRARRTGRSQPAGRKPLWATEFWWDSNPPDPNGVSVQTQAHWLEQALYLFWKQGVKRAVWFQIRDQPPVPDYASTYQTGLFQLDGTPKLAYQAFRFPFVADRLRRRLWGEQKTGNGAPPPEIPSAPAATEPVPEETATPAEAAAPGEPEAVEPEALEPEAVDPAAVDPAEPQ